MRPFVLITMLAIALSGFSQESSIDQINVPASLLNCGDSTVNSVTIANVSTLPLANTSVLTEVLDTGTMEVVYSFSTPGPNIGANDFHVFMCVLYGEDIGLDGSYIMRFTFLADYDENQDNVSPDFPILIKECCKIELVDSMGISCSGDTNGLLEVQGINGTPPYSYVWSTGENTPLIDNLGAGAYIITMFDNGGCGVQDTFVVADPGPISINLSTTDQTYVGAADGTAEAMPSGGTPPYTYLWSTGQTTSSINGLAPGDYSITVTDANGCMVDTSFTINAVICNVTVTISGPVEIEPGTSIVLEAIATDGVEPYQYAWNTGDMNNTLGVSNPGTYSVTVTDSTGCTAEATIVVELLCTLTCNISAPAFLCPVTEASILLNASGGYPPYSYEWSTGETSSTIVAGPGTYSVTVSDSEGCTSVCSRTINAYPEIVIDTVKVTPATGGMANGAIEMSVTGGTPPYVYEWYLNGTVVWTARDLADAIPGDYNLLVIDSRGCLAVSDTITIEMASAVIDIAQYQLAIYPNPASDVLYLSANQAWSGEIIDFAGRTVYSIPEGVEAEIRVNDFPNGIYSVVIEIDGQKIVKKVVISKK